MSLSGQEAESRKKDDGDGAKKRKKRTADSSAAPVDDPRPWMERPILVQCEDSYSVNVSAMSWLFGHAKARMIWLPDPWHSIHNVGLNSIKETGYYGSVQLTSIAMDVSWGPWGSEKWFRTMQNGLAEWMSHATEADPLVQAVLPRVAEERNWELHQSSFQDIQDALTKCKFLKSKGEKAQTTRWWVWHKRFGAWVGEKSDPTEGDSWVGDISDVNAEWSLRLIPLVYIGLQLGFISLKNGKTVLKALVSGQAAINSDGTMKSAKEQQQRVRESCKNQLHVATDAWCSFEPPLCSGH